MKILIEPEDLNRVLEMKLPSKAPLRVESIEENLITFVFSVMIMKLRFSLSNPSLNQENWLRFDVDPDDISSFVNLLLKFKPEIKDRIRTRPGRLAVKLPSELQDNFEVGSIEFIQGAIQIEGQPRL